MGEKKASRRSKSYILTAEDELYGWVQRPSLNSRNLFLFAFGASPQAGTGVEKTTRRYECVSTRGAAVRPSMREVLRESDFVDPRGVATGPGRYVVEHNCRVWS